ncbi:EamA family transporter [Chloroflexota bacterium]
MIWISAALITAAIMGVVAIIDSHLISKRMPSLQTFLMPVGILHLIFGLITLGLYPLPGEVGTTPLVVAFASGIARAIGVLLMLQAMRSEEISRIIPVVHTFPIFVAILAVPLLGEALGYIEWLSIFITVTGAVLISVRREADGRGARLRKSFALLLVCSLLLGVANTASKYALDYVSFWNMYYINATCFGIIFLFLSVRPKVLKELMDMKERTRALGLLTLNECIALVGIILSFWAIEQGPVSLVSTILSTRPCFVFIYALVLSRIFPAVLEERLSRGTLIIKITSIGLIISGVTLLTLSG